MSEVRVNPDSTVVITSENSAAYYAKKLDIAPAQAELKVVEQPAKVEVEIAPKVEAVADPEDEVAEKRPKIARRFSELTGQRDTARAETATERTKREAAEARVVELEAKLKPPEEKPAPVVDANEPKPEDFADQFEYNKAMIAYGVKVALDERDAKANEAKQKTENEGRVKVWQDRQATFRTATADYEETINNSTAQVSNQVRDAIVESEMGPQLLYYFGKNPAEAERLKPMSVIGALRELGKIEAKLEAAKPAVEVREEKPAAQISQAAAPITPLKGASAPAEVPINSKGEFTGTFAQWKAARAAGKIH